MLEPALGEGPSLTHGASFLFLRENTVKGVPAVLRCPPPPTGSASITRPGILFNVYLLLREGEPESGRGTERGGQRIRSGLCADSREPGAGLELTNPDMVI